MESLQEEFKKSTIDFCAKIMQAVVDADKENMGRDHIAQALACHFVLACKNFGLSKQFCDDLFDEMVTEIYEEEEEGEEGEEEEDEPSNCTCCSCCPRCTLRE